MPPSFAPTPTPPPRAPRGQAVLLGALAVASFGCDHATKAAAKASLEGGRTVALLPGVLELRYAQNDDTAFSVLQTFGVSRAPFVLVLVAALATLLVGAAWFTQRRSATPTQHVAFALLISGALGNVVDRAIRGYVVDFIHVTHWPVFNVADIVVVVGAVLLFVAPWWDRRREVVSSIV